MAKVTVKQIQYKEYGKCIEITNGIVDLVVTTEVGPRIIRFGFVNEQNEFSDDAIYDVQVGNEVWKLMGGHRLWHGPENIPRTYMPDNEKVSWTEIQNGIKIGGKIEKWTQIVKEMEITLSENGTEVKVFHKLTNKNAWPVEFSVWGLTAMAKNGKEIIPFTERDTSPLPNRLISLWPSAKMNDSRVYWGGKYITLKQNPEIKNPIKFGILNENGWVAYCNHNNLFINRFDFIPNGKYADFGVSYQTFTYEHMLELETLAPLRLVNPDETASHTEKWELIRDVEMPDNDDDKIEEMVKKYID